MKIAIIGYGKMGKAIEEIALKRGHSIVLRSSSSEPFLPADLKEADVAIEFTRPEEAVKNIFKCFDGNTPIVTGTTGWFNRLNEVKSVCQEKNQSLFYASNFSLGVNLFFQLNKELTRLMEPHREYSASMTEIHHTQKKDAPSGTAISLAEDLIYESTQYDSWVNDKSEIENELPIISERIDDVPGTHEICWKSEIDKIEIIHTAFGRQGFALGAIIAAEWLGSKKGVYTMKHLLNLES